MEISNQPENLNIGAINRGKLGQATGLSNKASALSDVKNTLHVKNAGFQQKCALGTPKVTAITTPAATSFDVYIDSEHHDHAKCVLALEKEYDDISELRFSKDIMNHFSRIDKLLNTACTSPADKEPYIYPDIEIECTTTFRNFLFDEDEDISDVEIPVFDDLPWE